MYPPFLIKITRRKIIFPELRKDKILNYIYSGASIPRTFIQVFNISFVKLISAR